MLQTTTQLEINKKYDMRKINNELSSFYLYFSTPTSISE